ncbi:MAG: penicillin amidase [Solirubrobacteraceae bacterium]|nr:penicillin amidase [Solirubrobacteraceae bacterium]
MGFGANRRATEYDRGMKLWGVVAVAAALVCASSAPARVIRAENVLPPGQSGYVSLTGVVNGTGSPHLYDQNQLFIDFQRKPFDFSVPAASTEMPFAGVTIERDAFGVPSVTGDTQLDAWKGAGYAVAQDRMFQMEAFRHATQGRLGDITGEGAVPDDIVARRDYYTPAERHEQFERLPPEFQQRLEAYRDGINAWIAHLQANPTELPGEFPATLTELTPWTVDDSLSIGIYLARTVPSSDGAELRNLQAIRDSGSAKVLDALMPLSIKGQRSTIPASEGRFPQGRPLSAKARRAAERRSLKYVAKLSLPDDAARSAELPPGRIGRVGGSSMFTVRKPGGGAILFNGPQLGFSAPELFVELGVHAPGLDVRGVTAAGAPVIAIGHNQDVAWGITSGLSDDDDLYAEKLVPGDPEKYYYKGKVLQMDCRDETITYSGPPTDLLGGTVPGSGSQDERFCRTIHGPVQARAGNVAYARRYAIWGRELETLEGLAAVDVAHNVRQVQAAVRKLTWNENLMAADSAGNIGYWHPGLIQRRPAGWDQRLPLPGDGRAEWPGLIPRRKLPSIINPKQGYLVNWNNLPSQGWTTGDGEASERVTGPYHRVGWLDRQVRALRKAPTFAGAETAVRREGTFAQQRQLAQRLLRRVARGATGPAKTVLQTLLAWDGDYATTDGAGTADPGVAAWETFKDKAAARAVAPLGAGAALFPDKPGTSHAFDMTDTESYALRTLSLKALRGAAADTAAALADRFGSAEPSAWRTPRQMYKVGTQGAGSPPPLPFFDRGTYEQIVELGEPR